MNNFTYPHMRTLSIQPSNTNPLVHPINIYATPAFLHTPYIATGQVLIELHDYLPNWIQVTHLPVTIVCCNHERGQTMVLGLSTCPPTQYLPPLSSF